MELYTFLPLYNVEIDDDIINQDFSDFRIITNDIFISQYENIAKNFVSDNFLYQLKNDIRTPYAGELYTREYAKYILCKRNKCYQPKNMQDENELKILRQEANDTKIEFDKFILLARLLKNGRLQIHNCYCFTPVYQCCSKLQNSTSIEHISSFFYSEKPLFENHYKLNESAMIEIVKNISLLKILDDKKMAVPIMYFLHYYSATNLFDRIIKLAIILESTMLANCREELKHKLRIRTCAFLQKDIDNILSIFYDVRSSIVHNGDIGTSLYKKIKNTLKYEYKTDVEILFYFIQKEIEPIIREVLYMSLNIFNSSETIKNYSQLVDEIDKNIMTKVTI